MEMDKDNHTFISLQVTDHSLTNWGQVTHICVGKLTIIGSDNVLSPGRRRVFIWTNTGILLIWTLGTNVSVILSKINTFPFKKMHLKMSSGQRRPFCLSLHMLNVLMKWITVRTKGLVLLKAYPCHHMIMNKIWWLCLVPTSTTRFASDVGYRITKI